MRVSYALLIREIIKSIVIIEGAVDNAIEIEIALRQI